MQSWPDRHTVPSEIRDELVSWCVAEAAALDSGRIKTAAEEVLQCTRLGEQCVVIERNRCLQDRPLLWVASTACAWRWSRELFWCGAKRSRCWASEMLDCGAKADLLGEHDELQDIPAQATAEA